MVYIPPEFQPVTVPKDEAYEGMELDEAVRAALPEGATVKWVATHDASFWAISSKIDTELADGTYQSYFLKVYTTQSAKQMALGEYEGSKALYATLPNNIPKPIATGALVEDPKKHFYIAEFKNMASKMPRTSKFVSVVAKLHQNTESPDGRFGFHITTYGGDYPIDTSWCDTWEEFFTRLMRNTMEKERLIQGPNEELDRLSPIILEHVIPRLLRPMESNGRKLKPVLLHGDLWHGNVAADNATDEPIFYDPCAFYGHNECKYTQGLGMYLLMALDEFAFWRAARYRTSRHHVRAYHKIAKVTEPSEDQDDRHALYAMRSDLMVSITWSANKQTRLFAIEEMKRLVEKYCEKETSVVET
ncbi:Fructosamine kinase-domain-containing protein [Xylaria venustula]|nr:Fructosamine kinase-domain-containing protein [Xylaria venustula]